MCFGLNGTRRRTRGRAKHGVWFEEAQSVFDDPHARFFADENHSEDEERFIALGMTGRLPVVVYCYRDDDKVVRIISVRKATRRERKAYEEGI